MRSYLLLFFVLSFLLKVVGLEAYAQVFDPDELTKIAVEARENGQKYFAEVGEKNLYDMAITFYKESMNHGKMTFPTKKEILANFKNELIITNTIKKLNERYPGKLIENPAWIWNNVGTVWARMIVLYCSTSEYMVIFGTQFPQEGFSGYYSAMDVWDIMMTGKMISHGAEPEEGIPLVYNPGDVSLLKRGKSRVYKMKEHTYMIDYGRGTIAKAFYQGVIAPHFFLNHDNYSMNTQLVQCGSHAIKNLANGKVDQMTQGNLSFAVGKLISFLSKIFG